MIYPLAPNGIYWTIQGEGTHTGTPMAFVRLAGCSVGCTQCDTNYTRQEQQDAIQIFNRVQAVTPAAYRKTRPWVWITGGEPCDHDLTDLFDLLAHTHRIALCTSGQHPHDLTDLMRRMVAPLYWISVSPHRVIPDLQGHEVKLVPGLGELQWEDLADTGWVDHFPHKWIQPLSGSDDLPRALDFVHTHPGWGLSTQTHKHWKLP
jgi:7-carboxy-7-deazaguanine synthase